MLAEITDALRRGDIATALSSARSFVAAEPANPVALHLLGVTLHQQGDDAAARTAFEQALELAPDRAETYFGLANVLLAAGDRAGATRRLHEAVALDPNLLGAYVTLTHLALAKGDRDEAARQLRLAQRVNPEHPQVRIAEGALLEGQGDRDGALKAFTAAATAAPKMAQAQLALGNAYLLRGMWPFAERALRNALELSPNRPLQTLRALAEALRRQGRLADAVAVFDELVEKAPGDHNTRAMRADLHIAAGNRDAALADLLALLERVPDHPRTVALACMHLGEAGRGDEALRIAEGALARSPRVDDLWRARLHVSGMLGEDAKAILDRWQAALPDSPLMLDTLAGYHQTMGDTATALAHARRALALNPRLQASTGVVLADEIGSEPESALRRVEALLPHVDAPQPRRELEGWAGLALDALGRHDEAATHWREMIRVPAPNHIPPPRPQPGDAAPAGEAAGTLLFSPPGLRVEFLLQSLKRALGPRLRLDRIEEFASADGFGRARVAAGEPEAGTAARWHAQVAVAGLDPATVVDWLPFVDGYTLEALRGARVVALLADPRDLLLGWMVHGSAQRYLFADDVTRSAEWLAATLEALADHRDLHPGAVHLVRMDRDAGRAEQALEKLLELPEPLAALHGPAPRFAPGHWRHYATPFADAFARLAPVAARLGYPD